jgi:hypothetical protein
MYVFIYTATHTHAYGISYLCASHNVQPTSPIGEGGYTYKHIVET